MKLYVHLKKKLNNKVKIAPEKAETKQFNLYFTRKNTVLVHKVRSVSSVTIRQKRTKTAKLKKIDYVFKNSSFQSNENY